MFGEVSEMIYAIGRYGRDRSNLFEIAKRAKEGSGGKLFRYDTFRSYGGRIYSEQLSVVAALIRRLPLFVEIEKEGNEEYFTLTPEGKKVANKLERCLSTHL